MEMQIKNVVCLQEKYTVPQLTMHKCVLGLELIINANYSPGNVMSTLLRK